MKEPWTASTSLHTTRSHFPLFMSTIAAYHRLWPSHQQYHSYELFFLFFSFVSLHELKDKTIFILKNCIVRQKLYQYLWEKPPHLSIMEGCLFDHVEISQTTAPLSALLVPLKSPLWEGLHEAFMIFRPKVQELVNIEQFCQRKFNKIKTKI